jgi:hypothetical protein
MRHRIKACIIDAPLKRGPLTVIKIVSSLQIEVTMRIGFS